MKTEFDDKGSMFIVKLDQDKVQVTVRSPGETRESRICIHLDEWLKMIAGYR